MSFAKELTALTITEINAFDYMSVQLYLTAFKNLAPEHQITNANKIKLL